MNQVITTIQNTGITITFTWLPSENKVYVKYYVWDKEISEKQYIEYGGVIDKHVDAFFNSDASFNLIKWSY